MAIITNKGRKKVWRHVPIWRRKRQKGWDGKKIILIKYVKIYKLINFRKYQKYHLWEPNDVLHDFWMLGLRYLLNRKEISAVTHEFLFEILIGHNFICFIFLLNLMRHSFICLIYFVKFNKYNFILSILL